MRQCCATAVSLPVAGRSSGCRQLGFDSRSVIDAVGITWTARPDLARAAIPISFSGTRATCIRLGADDPKVIEVALDLAGTPTVVTEHLSQYLADEGETGATPAFARAASDAEALEVMRFELGIEVPPGLERVLLADPPAELDGMAYRLRGPANGPPGLAWALRALREGHDTAPNDLVPILPVDERSFACVVVSRTGSAADELFGRVVRWHLGRVPARAQRAVLDLDAERYVAAAAADLRCREGWP